MLNNQNGEFIETVVDTLDTAATQEPQKRYCQLRVGVKNLLTIYCTFLISYCIVVHQWSHILWFENFTAR